MVRLSLLRRADYWCLCPDAQARRVIEREQGKYTRPIATECKKAMVYWPAEVSLEISLPFLVGRKRAR